MKSSSFRIWLLLEGVCSLMAAAGVCPRSCLWGQQATAQGEVSYIITPLLPFLSQTCEPSHGIFCLVWESKQQVSPCFIYGDRHQKSQPASKSCKQRCLKHEVYTCCRFVFPVQMCNLAFQKEPENSNPLLRTKDNSLSCGITRVSQEKGESPGAPPSCRAVLWACPGSHSSGASLCSLPPEALWLEPSYYLIHEFICLVGVSCRGIGGHFCHLAWHQP